MASASPPSFDPLQSTVPLPLEAEVFPMGHPLRLATNAGSILSAAVHLWQGYPRLYDRPAVRMSIIVGANRSPLSPAPVFRGREHLMSVIADQNNFATADLRSGCAFVMLNSSAHPDYVRYHFLEPLAYVLIAAKYLTFLHASCVALNGRSVLLCGDSGAGKTCLAFACARKRWTFITGDAAAIVRGRNDYKIIGRPFEIRFRPTARELFPELRTQPSAARPNGKADIELNPQELEITCALEGNVSHIVFLDRQNEFATASIESCSAEHALCRLDQAVCFGDERSRREQRQSLAHFTQLPVLRLRYSDFDTAERLLRSLVSRT